MVPFSDIQFNRQIQLIKQEFYPSHLIPSLMAALIAGTSQVIFAISFAPLIFSGDLATYISEGIGLTLFTTIAVNLVIAIGSSSPGIVSGVQEAPGILIGVTATAIVAKFSVSSSAATVLPTIVAALALTSILTGICCFLLGQFKLGNLIRFMPYPVTGGFLAGTGWLILLGSLNFMTDLSLPGEQFSELFEQRVCLQWLPGFCFGILLVVLLRRSRHFLLIPGFVLGAILLFYIALHITGTSTDDAKALGLLLQAFPSGSLWPPLSFADLPKVEWPLILSHGGQMFAVILITIISLLLNSTGLELAIDQDLNLNRELRVAGIANIVSGLGGGIIGYHTLGSSILSYNKLEAKSRMVGILIAAEIGIVLLVGASVISLFPKPVLGGMMLLLGADLLLEWVYDAWFKLPKADYAIVILILLVIATAGFLQGVGVGLVLAIVLFVINASRVNVTRHTLSGATYQSHAARSLPQARVLREEGEQIYILDLQGFLFFGTANTLLNRIQDRVNDPSQPPLKYVVLNFQSVNGLDSSAVLSFVRLKQLLQQQEIKLVLTDLSPTIRTQLKRGGCLLPDDPVCQVFPDLDRGLEWCENDLLGVLPLRRARSLPLLLQLNDLFPDRDLAAEFIDYLEEWEAEAGEVIFQQGQIADAIYLIEVGQVTVYLEGQQGQSHRIQTLGAGNVVGAIDFFRHSLRQTTAIVEAPSTLYRLSTENFQRLKQDHPEVAAAFQSAVIQILGDRLTWAYKGMADLLRS